MVLFLILGEIDFRMLWVRSPEESMYFFYPFYLRPAEAWQVQIAISSPDSGSLILSKECCSTISKIAYRKNHRMPAMDSNSMNHSQSNWVKTSLNAQRSKELWFVVEDY